MWVLFSPFFFTEKSNLIPGSRWQLSRYDHTINRTRMIVKKIIRLTIETGSLTGGYIIVIPVLEVEPKQYGMLQLSLGSCAFR